MQQDIERPTRIEHFGERLALLESLAEAGSASIVFLAEGAQPQPALLMEIAAGERLLIDLTAVAELAARVERGEPFQMYGQVDGAMLRTPPLRLLERVQNAERLQYACAYPDWVELLHRRSSYRAELDHGLSVEVQLLPAGLGRPCSGRLINLSLGGCLIELQASQAVNLDAGQPLAQLRLRFPGGQACMVDARICHSHHLPDWQSLRYGCQFLGVNAEQERRLWLYVREIEREKARRAGHGKRDLRPSGLFASRLPQAKSQPDKPLPGNAVARRLGRLAAYLDTQLIRLRLGGAIDSQQLSRFSDLLLDLLAEDREGLLFAVQHLSGEPLLVQHGIALAARMADMAGQRGLPREMIKAIVACALVHDFGKELLPLELRQLVQPSAEQRQAFALHVALLRERLDACTWLATPVVEGLIGAINERLDGSGYPQAIPAARLGELPRMAAVVDVVDTLGRACPEAPAQPIDHIYRHLLDSAHLFDLTWSQRYIRHFGLLPIGSLVRFAGGQLAWVRSLDGDSRVAEVQLTGTAELRASALGARLSGPDLAALGRLESVLVAGC